jgi:hypothetical protein
LTLDGVGQFSMSAIAWFRQQCARIASIMVSFLVYLFVFFSGGLVQMLVWNRITKDVNQRLPLDEQYSLSIWTLRRSAHGEFNQFRIWRTHSRFFPDSYLRVSYIIALTLTIVWMFIGLSVLYP